MWHPTGVGSEVAFCLGQSQEGAMLESVKKLVAVPEIPVQWLAMAGTAVGFGWLLFQDRIHPLVVYCLQMYLSF